MRGGIRMSLLTVNNFRRIIYICVSLLIVWADSPPVYAQKETRREIQVPNILGFTTLKADLHIHTVFSDGDVWPTVRVQELWLEGFDVFSITDHIEYQPHEPDIPKNHNRSYEIAMPLSRKLRLTGIRGGEISRGIPPPPGHYNAIFLDDVDPLDTPEFMDAMKAAADQDAFIFWNHPGYGQPNLIPVWYQAQTDVLEKGWLHGIEVANDQDYYPLAHQWCLEKKLTMIGTSDIHTLVGMRFDLHKGEHRTMTFLFVRENTLDGIKEALKSRRTAVWHKDLLIGEEKYLDQIFKHSVDIRTPELSIRGNGSATAQITNTSDIPFDLEKNGDHDMVVAPESIMLYPGRTVSFDIGGISRTAAGTHKVALPYTVKNLYVRPEEGMNAELTFTVRFVPEKAKE